MVDIAGSSVTLVFQGLPEGGVLGPILYPRIPNSLARHLRSEGFGIGIAPTIPPVWADIVWTGEGRPCEETVEALTRSG